jgi:D-alanyl-D-alanine carboxypeptidase
VPQPGDGDLWPKSDDDKRGKQSAPVSGAETHQPPAPDQHEEPASGGWFDPPAADEPASGSEKSHPKPAQQRTQPVSWPVADLAKQAKSPDAEKTVFVKPIEIKPGPSNATKAATAFATQPKKDKSTPGSPGKKDAGAKFTQSSAPEKTPPSDRGWFDSPAEKPEPPEAEKQESEPEPAEPAKDSTTEVLPVPDTEETAPKDADEPEPDAESEADQLDSDQAEEPDTTEDASPEVEEKAEEPADADSPDEDSEPTPADAEEISAEPDSPAEAEPLEDAAAPEEGEEDSIDGDAGPEEDAAEVDAPAEAEESRPEPEEQADEPEAIEADPPVAEEQAEADAAQDEEDQPDDTEPAQVAEAEEPDDADSTQVVEVAPDSERRADEPRDDADSTQVVEVGPDSEEQADEPRDDAGSTQVVEVAPSAEEQADEPQDDAPDQTSTAERTADLWPTAELAEPEAEPDKVEAAEPESDEPEPDEPKAAEPAPETVQPPAPETAQPKAKEPEQGGHLRPTQVFRQPESADLFRPAEKKPVEKKPVEKPAPKEEQDAPTAYFRPVAAPKPDWPRPPQEKPQEKKPSTRESEATTSLFRPVDPPRTKPSEATTFLRPPTERGRPTPPQQPPPPPKRPTDQGQRPPVDSPTIQNFRPVQPPRPPVDNPPSFVRPRTEPPKQEWPPPEPPRAAPQRVGPPPKEVQTARKGKKKLLIAAIAVVAVVGIAAGVVFGVPGVAEKLGLAGGENAADIAAPPAPISYQPGLHGPATSAPTPTKQGVQNALAGPLANPALGTMTGVVIDPATGETLYENNAGKAITPASTGKVLTAAAALLSLDHTEQLVTKVVQGDQPGEVIIVGGGDPTISSLKEGEVSMYPGAAHLSELVDKVKASGATVNTVYIDQSRYAAPHLAASWLPEDVANGYIAPIVPAMLDGDRRDATTNYSPRTNDPGRTLVNEFARRMGASPAARMEKKAPADAKVLGEIRSAPLSQLVDNMLDRSENTLGDILAHEVAIKAGQEPTFDGAAKAMLDILRQNKFDVDGVVLKDGSGMSTENKVSAKLLAEILAVAAGPDGKDSRTAMLRPLLGGLPVAGGSGTLADRYGQGAATEGRGWVRAKTGTLTGVNSLAGIVMDKDNRPLVFAFLTSGTNGSTARPALDTVSAALRGCGCQ